MREAIEKVIAELEEEAFHHGTQYANKHSDNREYHRGVEAGLDTAIDKLREALDHEETETNSQL